jgi:D-alanyl-D-alanine carboxypeptidase
MLILTMILTAGAFAAAPTDNPAEEEPGSEERAGEARLVFTPDDEIVYVPIRPLIESLGGIVEWSKTEKSVLMITPDGALLSHMPGTKTIRVNGVPSEIPLPSLLQSGVTYFPVSYIQPLLGSSAAYDSAANTISVDVPDSTAGSLISVLKSCAALRFYLPENLLRYTDYIRSFPEILPETAVAYVNVNLDKPFFSDIEGIEHPESLQVLCNKQYILPSDYVPDDLVTLSGTSQRLRQEAAARYEEMKKAAVQAGYWFTVYSGYRSYDTQKALFNRYARADGIEGADEYSARPGHSEHQAGLAVDITAGGSEEELDQTGAFKWLKENAHKYGFILRYPDGYTDVTGYVYESWHWRYIGVPDATRMFEEDIPTYEEYVGTYLVTP